MKQTIEIEATPRECSSAQRITSMARLPMYRRVLGLLVKVRKLQEENKQLRREAWERCGWQSEAVAGGE